MTDYEYEVNRFCEITESMREVFRKKRHDYGPSTTETYEKFGPISMLVRMHDKMSRLDRLLCNTDSLVQDESINDTLLDLANYAIITMLEREKYANREKEREYMDSREG